jgi:hypothetical protein
MPYFIQHSPPCQKYRTPVNMDLYKPDPSFRPESVRIKKRGISKVPFKDDIVLEHLCTKTPDREAVCEKPADVPGLRKGISENSNRILSFWDSKWMDCKYVKYTKFIMEYKSYCKYNDLLPETCYIYRVRKMFISEGHTFYYSKYLNKRTLYIRRCV